MSDVVGRGIVEVVADATNLQTGMAQATAAVDKFEQGATDSARKVGEAFKKTGTDTTAATDKLDGVTRRFIQSLEREALQVGKTRAEYLELRAAKLGVTSTAAPFIAQLREAEKNVAGVGMSAKQTAAALRGVPAQLTDIVTSLQGGQQPLTVFLQQGGQLRDMFGGAGPAARALGSAVLNLVNPFTVAAAAAAALGIAYFQGSKEADAYARAIILTGNAAGSTVGEMQAMAAAVAANVGTQAQAAEAIAGLAQSGKVASASLDDFAETAVRLERTTGKAIGDTVKEFAELGKAPVEASRRLNEQYNYLTFAVYEQIRALEEQGRVQEAAQVAQEAYASAFNQRADQLVERLGYIERAWQFVGDKAKGAWDSMLDIGRSESPEQRIASLQRQLESLDISQAAGGEFGGVSAETYAESRQALQAEIDLLQNGQRESRKFAQQEAERAAATKAAIDAEKEIDRIRQASLTKQEKLSAELAKYRQNIEAIRRANPNSNLLDPDRIARDEANIRERFRDRTRPRAVTDDAATRLLQQLREAEAATRAQLDTTEKLTGSQKRLVEFEQQIADLKEKRSLTADQKSVLAAQDAIRAQLEKNVAVEKELRLRDEAAKAEKKRLEEIARFEERAAQIQQSISAAGVGRAEQYDSRLSVFGLGSQAREQLESQVAIQREFRRYQEQLDKATPKDLLGGEQYQSEVEKIKAGLEEALEANRAYYEQLREMQGEWSNGATEAVQNYLDAAADVAGQTNELFSNAFRGMEDALVEFVKTGKLDFKSLVDSIITDLLRLLIRREIAGLVGSFFGGASGAGASTGGIISSLISGTRAIGGPVSAGNAYQVNENGPELLSLQGRQILLMGNQHGMVRPVQGGGGGGVTIVQNMQFGSNVNRSELAAWAEGVKRQTLAEVQRSATRGGALS